MKWSKELPLLRSGNHKKTSEPTTEYNCIAWAAGETQAWWWPDREQVCYWPDGIPREETLTAFVRAYETLGYVQCNDNAIEKGIEKVAIYALNGVPTHAARQLKTGRWTSKLGPAEDIEHELGALEGPSYGNVVFYLKRARPASSGQEKGGQEKGS